MRKLAIIAVISIAAAALALAADECTVHEYKCAQEGDTCVGDFHTNGTKGCDGEAKCCAIPLYCINGTCQEDNRGKDCKVDSDCIGAMYGNGLIACIKKKCVVQGSFNDSCTKDDHCAGNQTCVKGVCSGLNVSSACSEATGSIFRTNFQCGMNLTCVKGQCVAPKAIGENCASDDECDVYSICNDGKCTELWTVKFNETCDHYYSCEKDLYCDLNIKKCLKTVPHQYVVCKGNSDCAGYGNSSTCDDCNAITGERFCTEPQDVELDCISEMIAAFKCYRKNGCAPVPSSSLDTCAQLECTAETNAIFTCRSKCEDFKRVSGAKCLASIMLRYCPLLPTWLRITIAFSILIVIIVCVFIAYGIYRCCKKSQYTELPSEPETH